MVSSKSESGSSAKREGPVAWDPHSLLRPGPLPVCALGVAGLPILGSHYSPVEVSQNLAFVLPFWNSSASPSGRLALPGLVVFAAVCLWVGWLLALRSSGIQALRREREEALLQCRWTEEALVKSRASLLILEKLARIGSWELDLTTMAVEWSDETYRIFGRKRGQFLPSRDSFYQAVHDQDRAAVRSAIERAIAHAQPYSIEHRVLLPDGRERLVREQGEVISNTTGGKVVGTVQDVTEQKRIDDKLRQVVKMEAVGRLAGGVAHEFNNILTVILGHVDLLLVDSMVNRASVDSLLQIRSSAERAANLTRQLLAFGRRQMLLKQEVDVNEVVESMGRMLQPLLGEDVILEVRCSAGLPWIEADAGMIEQVLVNLAINARDAMPRGGRLTIMTRACRFTERDSSQHPESRPGTFVGLTISDTGCGMDEATIKRLFEPFFTTKPVGTASGLGLATIYGIVKQHDGWIEVGSTPEEGSIFTVFLPALDHLEQGPGTGSVQGTSVGLSL